MGGELRINRVGRGQQLARAGQIRDVGVNLAGKDRVAVQAVKLGALDFAVPVSTLDQSDHQPVAAAARQVDQVVDHVRAALLIGLHYETDAVPAPERRVKTQAFQQVERKLQPVGFLGVDVQADVVLARQQRELEQPRQQLAHHAVTLGPAVARVQRRQLDGYARPFVDAAPMRGLADGMDRLLIRGEVAFGILPGNGRLAQHVIGIAKARLFERAAVGQCFRNGLPGDELLPHQLHGAVHALADQRLAALADQPGQRRGQAFFAAGGGQLAGQHQAPDGGVDEHRRRIAQVRMPVTAADLVANQRVTRGVVGNAQQRLGQAHQRHALLAGERELLHQRLHAAGVFLAAQALHQAGGHVFNGGTLAAIDHMGELRQHGQAFHFGPMPGGGNGGAEIGLGLHVLRPVQKGLCELCSAKRRCQLFGVLQLSPMNRVARSHGCTLGNQPALDTFHVLQHRLLDKPVGGATLLGGGLPDAASKRLVNLQTKSDCGHGCTFSKISTTNFMGGATRVKQGETLDLNGDGGTRASPGRRMAARERSFVRKSRKCLAPAHWRISP